MRCSGIRVFGGARCREGRGKSCRRVILCPRLNLRPLPRLLNAPGRRTGPAGGVGGEGEGAGRQVWCLGLFVVERGVVGLVVMASFGGSRRRRRWDKERAKGVHFLGSLPATSRGPVRLNLLLWRRWTRQAGRRERVFLYLLTQCSREFVYLYAWRAGLARVLCCDSIK